MNDKFQNLKSQFGGRVSSIQMQDANAKRQELSAEADFIYTGRLRFKHAGSGVEIAANQELACVSISGEFDVPFFTVNSQDRCGFSSLSIGKVKIGSLEYEVFTKDGVVTDSQSQLLRSVELTDLISLHPFRRGEAVHFYRNSLILYARVKDLSAPLVHRIIALAEIIPVDNNAADIGLPSEFADLEDILKDWGMSDDMERSDKIEQASERELRRILVVAEPRFEAINSYLKNSENLDDDASANLARIAETVIEVKLALLRGNL